jgi:hypothetical protein
VCLALGWTLEVGLWPGAGVTCLGNLYFWRGADLGSVPLWNCALNMICDG